MMVRTRVKGHGRSRFGVDANSLRSSFPAGHSPARPTSFLNIRACLALCSPQTPFLLILVPMFGKQSYSITTYTGHQTQDGRETPSVMLDDDRKDFRAVRDTYIASMSRISSGRNQGKGGEEEKADVPVGETRCMEHAVQTRGEEKRGRSRSRRRCWSR